MQKKNIVCLCANSAPLHMRANPLIHDAGYVPFKCCGRGLRKCRRGLVFSKKIESSIPSGFVFAFLFAKHRSQTGGHPPYFCSHIFRARNNPQRKPIPPGCLNRYPNRRPEKGLLSFFFYRTAAIEKMAYVKKKRGKLYA